jgi:hypothetical protein
MSFSTSFSVVLLFENESKKFEGCVSHPPKRCLGNMHQKKAEKATVRKNLFAPFTHSVIPGKVQEWVIDVISSVADGDMVDLMTSFLKESCKWTRDGWEVLRVTSASKNRDSTLLAGALDDLRRWYWSDLTK